MDDTEVSMTIFKKKFEEIMNLFEMGFDVKESMFELFQHFIDVHILKDNKWFIEQSKELRT